MKKLLLIALSALLFALPGCSEAKKETADIPKTSETIENTEDITPEAGEVTACEIACISSPRSLAEVSAQAVVTATNAFADENSKKLCCIEAKKDTKAAYLAAIRLAAENGAKLIVLTSDLFSEALSDAQEGFPTVRFIAVNGNSMASAAPDRIKNNTAIASPSHEIGGYLAGYASVFEQKTRLAIVGSESNEYTNAGICGFLQGAQAAADALGLPDKSISVRVVFAGDSSANSNVAAELFSPTALNGPAEIVFACTNELTEASLAAAETAGGLVIGTDGDYSLTGANMLTFIRSNISGTVSNLISKAFTNSDWLTVCGKKNFLLATDSEGSLSIGLMSPDGTIGDSFDKYAYFSVSEYQELASELLNGSINVIRSSAISSSDGYPLASDFTASFPLSKLSLTVEKPVIPAAVPAE